MKLRKKQVKKLEAWANARWGITYSIENRGPNDFFPSESDAFIADKTGVVREMTPEEDLVYWKIGAGNRGIWEFLAMLAKGETIVVVAKEPAPPGPVPYNEHIPGGF